MANDRIDLESRARNMVGGMIQDGDELDLDSLRDDLSDRCHEEADSAVTYYSWADQIVEDYERQFGDDAESNSTGETFAPADWRKAKIVYAYFIAEAALRHYAEKILDEVEEAADDLIADAAMPDGVGTSDLRVSLQNPYTGIPPIVDRGVLIYEGVSEGERNAVAVDAGPFWLSYAWTPEVEEEGEDA